MTATLEDHITSLETHGFAHIETHPKRPALTVGARVRHGSELWYEAVTDGTATVRAVMRRGTDENPDLWERDWHRPNIELVIESDKPRFGSRFSQWADYHTVTIDT